MQKQANTTHNRLSAFSLLTVSLLPLNILVLMSPLLMITRCNVSSLSLSLSLSLWSRVTTLLLLCTSGHFYVWLCDCVWVCVCVCVCEKESSGRLGDLTSWRLSSKLHYFSGWRLFTLNISVPFWKGCKNPHSKLRLKGGPVSDRIHMWFDCWKCWCWSIFLMNKKALKASNQGSKTPENQHDKAADVQPWSRCSNTKAGHIPLGPDMTSALVYFVTASQPIILTDSESLSQTSSS